jgi:predicted nuclease of predicted toxin-antitoxin system
MRAKLDENLPVEAAEFLRAAGWECDSVYEEGLAGADDPEVAAACQAGARVLFTLDLDFADIRAYPPSEYVGIVVLRPTEPSRRQVLQVGEPRASSLVGRMDRASAVDCGASARSHSGCERARGVTRNMTAVA